jgi:NAD(P)-dependent dehydrogenase (short-subunit alcohol dehydrogenase family)
LIVAVLVGRGVPGRTDEDGVVSSSLAGQVAVVTGASRGIGRAIAEHLAARGAVVAGVARPSPALRELAGGGRRAGLISVPADVSVPAEVDAAFTAAAAELGPPTLVVAAAGTADVLGPLADADTDRWWQAVAVDLYGTMLTTRAAARAMLPRRTGRIVTVYGNLGDHGTANLSAFAVAKAGIARLTETLATELADTGVNAFCIHPGFARTPMTERLATSDAGRTWLPSFAATAADHWGSPQPAADLIEAIALGHADQLTGRLLHPDDDLTELTRRCHTNPDLRHLRLHT